MGGNANQIVKDKGGTVKKATASTPGQQQFRATVLQSGKTATGIRVPPEVVEALGAGKKPPVRVTMNGHTYRSTVATLGGEFMLPVSAEVRKGAGVAAATRWRSRSSWIPSRGR